MPFTEEDKKTCIEFSISPSTGSVQPAYTLHTIYTMTEHELTQAEQATNAETWKHIDLVMQLLGSAQIELMRRQFTHDRTKLIAPEVSVFTEYTPKLATSTYGSEEYKGFLEGMKPALDNHYAHNRHHPEFFQPCPESESINTYLLMAQWAIDNAQVLPDDIHGYEQMQEFLRTKQKEYCSSVNNMNLFDVIEMLVDWICAVARHRDGDIYRSIEINTERFSLSPQLVQIFKNTVPLLKNEFSELKTQKDLCELEDLHSI